MSARRNLAKNNRTHCHSHGRSVLAPRHASSARLMGLYTTLLLSTTPGRSSKSGDRREGPGGMSSASSVPASRVSATPPIAAWLPKEPNLSPLPPSPVLRKLTVLPLLGPRAARPRDRRLVSLRQIHPHQAGAIDFPPRWFSQPPPNPQHHAEPVLHASATLSSTRCRV
jgi:hypothetical protein